MTRRELATLAASASAAAAQAPAPAEDLGQAAKAQIRNSAAALDKFKLDMAVEPAFQFKA